MRTSRILFGFMECAGSGERGDEFQRIVNCDLWKVGVT